MRTTLKDADWRSALAVLLTLVAACATDRRPSISDTGQAATSRTAPQCYEGPIEVRVLNPDGSPAVGACLGLFDGIWYSDTGQDPPPWLRKSRTDADGRYHLASWRECMWPTFIYAFDADRKLAGFRLSRGPDELAQLQTIQLQPARWVTGEIACPQLTQRGERPDIVYACLSPVTELRLRSRMVRCAQAGPSLVPRFQFLLPPGRYGIDLACAGSETRYNVPVEVPAGDTEVDLGRFDLVLSPLVRLLGQPAPPLSVVEWSDGKARSLADLRGRPVLLCFWHSHADLAKVLREVFQHQRQLQGSDGQFLMIHGPEPGGVAAIRRDLKQFGANSDDAGIEYDPEKWPFPTAVDRAADQVDPWGHKIGATAAPYGEFVLPLFVLIDRDGKVAATSQWKQKEFDDAVQKLLH